MSNGIRRTITCRHCGETVRAASAHGRTYQQLSRAEHDQRMRESDRAAAVSRLMGDRDACFAILARGAAGRGGQLVRR